MVGKSKLSTKGARICSWTGRGCVLAAGVGAAMVLFGGAPATDRVAILSPAASPGDTKTKPSQNPKDTGFNEFELMWSQFTAWDGPAPETPDSGTRTTIAAPSRNELTYLGIIKMGQRQRALMSIDGQQRFLKEGQSVGPVTLVSIAEDHVMIRERRASRRINRLAESTEKLGYLGKKDEPRRMTRPDAGSDDMGLESRSDTRRRDLADRIERGTAFENAAPTGVPAAKARNVKRFSDDGQEGS